MNKSKIDPIDELLYIIGEQDRLQKLLDTTGGTEDTLIELIALNKRATTLGNTITALRKGLGI